MSLTQRVASRYQATNRVATRYQATVVARQLSKADTSRVERLREMTPSNGYAEDGRIGIIGEWPEGVMQVVEWDLESEQWECCDGGDGPQVFLTVQGVKDGLVEKHGDRLFEKGGEVGLGKTAGWWAIDPDTGRSVPPPVDKGGLQNAIPRVDPDQARYLGDEPLDLRIDFVERIDQVYRRTWNRPVTKEELTALFEVPTWVAPSSRSWPCNQWVDAATDHMGVPDSVILSLSENSIVDARALWMAYKLAYDHLHPSSDVTYKQPYQGEPVEVLLQHFYDHIEASISLHYQDAQQFVGDVPAAKMPSWAKRAAAQSVAEWVNEARIKEPRQHQQDLALRSLSRTYPYIHGNLAGTAWRKLERPEMHGTSVALSQLEVYVDDDGVSRQGARVLFSQNGFPVGDAHDWVESWVQVK